MSQPPAVGYGALITSWLYGLVCGVGIAATTVGMLNGEALPGVIWPALTPLLCAPLLILFAMRWQRRRAS